MLDRKKLIEEGYEPGNDITQSVYILSDGTLWDGGFDLGSRGVEHREVEVFTTHNRYDGETFWKEVLIDKKLVMVVPEWKEILIHPDYKVSEEQEKQIKLALEKGFIRSEFK